MLVTRQSPLLTFEHDFTPQMNAFIASDEIGSATHLQIRIKLATNVFIAGDKRVLCWGLALLTLEANSFCAGHEHFSAGDERIEPVCSSFNQAHTAPATSKQDLCGDDYTVTATYLRNGRYIMLQGSKRYLDSQQHLWLH